MIAVVETFPQRAAPIVASLERVGVRDDIVVLPAHDPACPTHLGRDPRCMIVSGGPGSVMEIGRNSPASDRLGRAAALLRGALSRRVPVLGICMGHQLLAYVEGGHVGRARALVRGVETVECEPDPLFSGIDSALLGFEYHHDEVVALPVVGGHPARRIASSATCRIEGFSIPGRLVWGLQFHPEVDGQLAMTLLDKAALESLHRAENQLLAPSYEAARLTIFRNFLRLAEVTGASCRSPR